MCRLLFALQLHSKPVPNRTQHGFRIKETVGSLWAGPISSYDRYRAFLRVLQTK